MARLPPEPVTEAATTVGAAAERAVTLLRAAGSPSARLDAEVLLAHVIGRELQGIGRRVAGDERHATERQGLPEAQRHRHRDRPGAGRHIPDDDPVVAAAKPSLDLRHGGIDDELRLRTRDQRPGIGPNPQRPPLLEAADVRDRLTLGTPPNGHVEFRGGRGLEGRLRMREHPGPIATEEVPKEHLGIQPRRWGSGGTEQGHGTLCRRTDRRRGVRHPLRRQTSHPHRARPGGAAGRPRAAGRSRGRGRPRAGQEGCGRSGRSGGR